MNDLYLVHHGILGQKWGVRRFQNKDGSLTKAGQKRLHNYADRNQGGQNFEKKNESIKKAGISSVDSETDKIAKGSRITRFADSGETLDNRRKYASLTLNDLGTYSESMLEGMLYDSEGKDKSAYTYSANRDLKVASLSNVQKYVQDSLISSIGDKKLSEIESSSSLADEEIKNFNSKYKDITIKQLVDSYNLVKNTDKNNSSKDEISKNYANSTKEIYELVAGKYFDKNVDNISKHYLNKGYDAIVDMWDAFDVAEYPVVLLNPKDSVSLKYEEKL